MNSLTKHVTIEELIGKHTCQHCQNTYAQKSSLTRHMKDNSCRALAPVIPKGTLVRELADLREQNKEILEQNKVMHSSMQKITESLTQLQSGGVPSSINNNNLQVMCLNTKDNLLDILASREGLPNALTYIKGCALARLAGDCRILEKAYKLESEKPAIMYANKSKTQYVYYDERQRRTIESNSKVMAKKLADILQRSYLKGMESFRTDLLGEEREDYVPPVTTYPFEQMPELEPYDMQAWNAHIHELRDEKYQKKVLSSMRIPFESDLQRQSSS
jgi:hypothetical protein